MEGGRADNAGIIDQNIDGPAGRGLGKGRFDTLRIGDVELDCFGAGNGLGSGFQPDQITAHDHHLRALGGEAFGAGQSDARAAAGDDGAMSCQLAHAWGAPSAARARLRVN